MSAPAGPAGGHLNLFQRSMRRWRELHPYNPVHVLRVAAPLELPRLRQCLAAALPAVGLDAAAVELQSATVLHTAIEAAFNRRFEPDEPPLRAFVVDAGGSFQLALAYDHYLAGGDAIAQLLGGIGLDYLGAGSGVRLTPSARPPTYRRLLWRHPLWWLHALAAWPTAAAQARRACRVPAADLADPHNGFVAASLGGAAALQQTARAWGVTLNDLLLAALLQVLSPQHGGWAARRRQPRRRQIAVASIINIRADFGAPARTWPAPCLAGLRVQHEMPEGTALQSLAQELHRSTAGIKRRHLYLHSLLGLGLSGLVWRWLSPAQRAGWFPKHHPLWAGLTSLNLNPQWQAARAVDSAAAQRLDYLRAVPTGPLCPLVLAATTSHDSLHLSLAYRRSARTPDEAAALLAQLVAALQASLGAAAAHPVTEATP